MQSVWNTPLLPVKKSHTNDYKSVQDPREVNKRVVDKHPTVPNHIPCSAYCPRSAMVYCPGAKECLFQFAWAPKSQLYFALERHDPEIRASGQLTWTRLPRGFNNFSPIFDEALHEDLGESTRPKTQMLACCRILMTY